MSDGWYYLHTNGELIYKPAVAYDASDFDESPFVRRYWPVTLSDRETAWCILVEALAMGAKRDRVDQLAQNWGCNDADALNYADRIGVLLTYQDGANGRDWTATAKQEVAVDRYGGGPSALDALADLAKQLDFATTSGRRNT